MKKLIFIWLMLVYGISSSGMSVYITYCCDEVQEIGFNRQAEMPCPDDNQDPCLDDAASCCYIGQVSAERNSDQQAENIFKSVKIPAITTPFSSIQPEAIQTRLQPLSQEIHPPPVSPRPLFSLYCSYLI